MSSNPQEQNNFNLDRKQKLAVGFLIFFAISFIFLWFRQFKQNLNSPLNLDNTKSQANESPVKPEEDSTESLKAKDTDKDGLSDYDEFNVYQTSPYLEDSDSDGISDSDEIKKGANPNCPVGRTCGAVLNTEEGAVLNQDATGNEIKKEEKNLTDYFDNSGNGETENTGGKIPSLNVSSSTTESGLKDVLSGNTDAKSLRKMLLEAGMDAAMLNKVSDEALMKSYKETLNTKN